MTTPQIRTVALSALVLSSTGPQVERRKHFDKTQLAELASSLKTHGILQPIVARQVNGHFEIVAGERRFVAAQQAGLQALPVNVLELTDEQVLEVQLIENLQRADLHPLQEAEGYEQLMKQHSHRAEELGDKVGKSKAYVYARLKLLALCKEARGAFYDGKLNPSTALLLARIPDQELQKKALKEITTPRRGWDGPGDPMSVREAAKHIQDDYMLRLSTAGFKTADATLVPQAGACGPCPKRTGNQPELFHDVKGADVCTDLNCFRAKIAAHAARVIADAERTGQKILTGKAAKDVARYGVENHSLQGYVRLDARDYHGRGNNNTTYRKTLGKSYIPTLLQDPDTGKMIEVAPERDVAKAHGEKPIGSSGTNPQRTQELKRKRELAYRVALFQKIHAAPATDFDAIVADVCLAFFDRLDSDTQKRFFQALGWEPKKRKTYGGYDTDAQPYIEKMTTQERWTFLRALTVAGDLPVFNYSIGKPDRMLAVSKRYKVDAAKVRSEIDAAEKARAKAKKRARN